MPRPIWFLLAVASWFPDLAVSQDLPAAEEIVRCFAETYAADSEAPPSCESLSTGVTGIQASPERYPASLVEGVMNGLADLAVSHPDKRVRRSAAVWIAVSGTAAKPPVGVLQRMWEVYDRSDDPDVRAVLVNYSPRQKETEEATRFLVHAATGDRGRNVAPFPDEVLALEALSRTGPRGRAALQQLHAAQSVKTEAAKERLIRLEREDFRPIDYND
jgi:hypothetical protein